MAAGRTVREGRRIRKNGMAILVCSLGLASVIAPWTIRNWFVLHSFVPISTNGGVVFYSGNGSLNPREQGSAQYDLYVELYRDFDSEVERDRAGWRRGNCQYRCSSGCIPQVLFVSHTETTRKAGLSHSVHTRTRARKHDLDVEFGGLQYRLVDFILGHLGAGVLVQPFDSESVVGRKPRPVAGISHSSLSSLYHCFSKVCRTISFPSCRSFFTSGSIDKAWLR